MSKFRKQALTFAGLIGLMASPAWAEGDAAAGEKVFKKCTACHAVGEGARHKVGPQLNGITGRVAGTAEGYKYSKPMIEAGTGGLAWNAETVAQYLRDPKGFVKGNKMAFAGLKDDAEVANVIAYLAGFPTATTGAAEASPAGTQTAEATPAAEAAPPPAAAEAEIPSHGVFHLGRKATDDEIAAWDIDIRPDGLGLPEGKGTVARGEELYVENCAVCHGEFGEAVDRWPVLAGGHDSLKNDRPEKTVGSYWPHVSTVYDYIRRAMPFGSARSLSDDDVYALTAYVLYLNDVVTDQDFELSRQNFSSITLPNADNFIPDDRLAEPHYAAKKEPCMKDCKASVEITAHAQVLDVTPDSDGEGQGAIE
jgi:cytochrome c